MKVYELRKKSIKELKIDLLEAYKEKLNLNIEKTKERNFKKRHLLKMVKLKISRILTIISEKGLTK